MKRRVFLGASAGTAAVLAGVGGCERKISKTSPKALSVLGNDGKLAEKTLEELLEEYRYWIYDDYIPFHDKWVVDHEYGGFTLSTGWNGPTLNYNKSAWYEGRGTWTYSFLYNKIDPNPKHLKAARRSVEFILKHKPDGDNLWPASYDREGKVTGGPGNQIYGDIFIANALSEYSKAAGDDTYWDLAKEIMLKCLRIYDRPGYYPDAAQAYLGKEAPLLPGGARIGGHWFILLRLATQMLEFKSDPEVEAVAARCVDAVMNYHVNPAFDLCNEVINHDLSRPDNDVAQFVYTGHAIETLWMVLYEVVRIRDKALFDRTAKLFRRHCEVAWDDVYGGLFHSLEHVDKNVWRGVNTKCGWLQMEGLIGSMCIIEHTGDEWAKKFFDKLYTYVMDKFPLKKYGYPLWQDYTNRKAEFKPGEGGRRAENLHHPRHLMLNYLAIERMIKRSGKVSGIFG